MPYEAKTDWKYDDLVTEKDMNRIEQGLKDAHIPAHQPLTLNPGLQVVEVENDTPFYFGSVRGRTRVNLLGRNGRCDKIDFFGIGGAGNVVVDSTIKRYGEASFKITQPVGGITSYVINGNFVGLDRSKKYMFAVDVLLTSMTAGGNVILNLQQSGAGAVISTSTANGELLGAWQTVHATFDASKLNSPAMSIVVGTMGDGAVTCNVDGVRCYEITQAEYDASVSLNPEEVATLYPYIEGITNVTNPYAIVTGGNLLPPFYEWEDYTSGFGRIESPYSCSIEGAASVGRWYQFYAPALPNATYTLTGEVSNETKFHAIFCDKDKKVVDETRRIGTFTTSADTAYIRVLANTDTGIGLFTFKKPILTVGSEPKPFTPQRRSMLAFETELAAHPVDGSNPDTLFMGDDGLPYVLESWGKMVVSGAWNWQFNVSEPTHKRVFVPDLVPAYSVGIQQYMSKYNGQYIPMDGAVNDPDQFQIQPGTGYLYVSVPNTDSGWGPDYEPEPDEIKAYFFGWKLTLLGASVGNTPQYNGTGEKAWIPIVGFDGMNGTNITPTFESSYARSAGWQPYCLQYLKAKPTVEPVRNYELGATLCAGSNMVEVGSGIVIREHVNPPENTNPNLAGRREINYTQLPNSKLNYKTNIILNIFKNHTVDHQWSIGNGTPSVPVVDSYGLSRANLPGAYYDPAAVYHVTYTMLDPTLAAPISGTVAANLRGTVSDLVQHTGDMERRLSVVENQNAEMPIETEWIKPTLINGWAGGNNGDVGFTPMYRRKGDYIEFRGALQGGIIGEALFVLPSSLRPKYFRNVATSATTNGANTTVTATSCYLNVSEGVCIIRGTTANGFVMLDGLRVLI
ncbi:hypothetical protein ABU162_13150 [Paenibacillus thiaminolyticus]|uniref:hypothetical protein n=1 Tax=Paenibacillus thiaminolyticus TaxID=49283 RepID=UPI0035A715A0